MEYTWRWYGANDPISLAEIRQTGATGLVTALHEIGTSQAWPEKKIAKRKAMIEDAGLSWSMVESVVVTEAVRTASPKRDDHINAYAETLRRLGAAGIKTVCYNFMPVADWTRTTLMYPLAHGGKALAFNYIACVAFDIFLLERPGAADYYPEEERIAAEHYLSHLDEADRQQLIENITAGLPGSNADYDLASFREAVAAYEDIDHATLRENMRYFLERIIPVAEEAGVRMALHPDDPPLPLFGLPRIVSNADDARWILEAVDSPANGLTLCAGSYSSIETNDLVAMAREFGSRIHFAHLRSVLRDPDEPRSFNEAEHLGGDTDITGIMNALIDAEDQRGGQIPMRADHGHHILGDADRDTRAGYPLYGRLRGLSELRDLEIGLRYQRKR